MQPRTAPRGRGSEWQASLGPCVRQRDDADVAQLFRARGVVLLTGNHADPEVGGDDPQLGIEVGNDRTTGVSPINGDLTTKLPDQQPAGRVDNDPLRKATEWRRRQQYNYDRPYQERREQDRCPERRVFPATTFVTKEPGSPTSAGTTCGIRSPPGTDKPERRPRAPAPWRIEERRDGRALRARRLRDPAAHGEPARCDQQLRFGCSERKRARLSGLTR